MKRFRKWTVSKKDRNKRLINNFSNNNVTCEISSSDDYDSVNDDNEDACSDSSIFNDSNEGSNVYEIILAKKSNDTLKESSSESISSVNK